MPRPDLSPFTAYTSRYHSPTDVVGDRFNSNSLRLLTTVSLVIPLFIYATVQFVALADIIEGLSLGRIQRHTAAYLLCGVIVVCEMMGGQRSVTITDTIQAAIMLSAFLVMPFVLVYLYGGLPDIVEAGCPRSQTVNDSVNGVYQTGCVAYSRPWVTMQPTVVGTCDYTHRFTDPNCFASTLNVSVSTYAATNQPQPSCGGNGTRLPSCEPWMEDGLDPDDKAEFQHMAISMLMFNLNGMAFGLNPHILQKVFAARSDTVLKHSLMLLAAAALVTNLPSLYYGFVRVAAMQESKGSAFAVVTGEMIDHGGFSELVAVVASCSALAAIMSTADSVIIGANNLLTVEWVKNFGWRKATAVQLGWVSRAITLVFAVAALELSFALENKPFGALFNLQVSTMLATFCFYDMTSKREVECLRHYDFMTMTHR